jgi:hypothetical protein
MCYSDLRNNLLKNALNILYHGIKVSLYLNLILIHYKIN